MSEEYAEIFKEEAAELLEELEEALLELEETPDDLKIVGRVFRAMHTIKGSGAMFGFDDIADFTHHVETALDKVREGLIPASKELIDLILVSRDHISNLLDATTPCRHLVDDSNIASQGRCFDGIDRRSRDITYRPWLQSFDLGLGPAPHRCW